MTKVDLCTINVSLINEMDALSIQMEDKSKNGVMHAIRNTKKNKAAGDDNTTTGSEI